MKMKIGRGSMGYIMRNKWTIATLVIALFMLVVIGQNLIHAIFIRVEIATLNSDKERYQSSITADSTLIEHLKYDHELERYAREHYYMQRTNEEIFILKGVE